MLVNNVQQLCDFTIGFMVLPHWPYFFDSSVDRNIEYSFGIRQHGASWDSVWECVC